MKSVMLSIKPKWCEMIANGRKTIEVRKNRPKLETPFKCYIYCTKPRYEHEDFIRIDCQKIQFYGGQKVIGEFVCDRVDTYDDDTIHAFSHEDYTRWNDYDLYQSCIHPEDFEEYAADEWLYGWHISDLVIYDEPKELSRFYKEDFHEALSNWEDLFSIGLPKGCAVEYPPEPKEEDYVLKRPPQSWCYVEEVEE